MPSSVKIYYTYMHIKNTVNKETKVADGEVDNW